MASSKKLLEVRIMEIGDRLQSASSVEDLLYVLDKTESLLSRVDQSPPKMMRSAFDTTKAALVSRKLLRHSDLDVKVSVASCISEITRIMAPEAPYEDDVMKEALQLIVQAFEKFDDLDSRSHMKRVSILETVSKVRLCVVMLNLECDALILEMFNHFLRTIRSTHPESVFSAMETIMTLVLEESEEISSDLVSCLVNSVKRDTKVILSISHKLAEKVISNSAVKLNLYISECVTSKDSSSHEFIDTIRLICAKGPDEDQNPVNSSSECLADDSKLSELTLSEELPQEPEAACLEGVSATANKPLMSVTCNGTTQTADMDSAVEPASSCLKNHSRSYSDNQASDREDLKILDSVLVKPEDMPNINAKGKFRKKTLAPANHKNNLSRSGSDNDVRSISSRKGAHDDGSSSDDGSLGRETESEFHDSENDTKPATSAGNGTLSDALPTNNETSGLNQPRRGRAFSAKRKAKRADSSNSRPAPSSKHDSSNPYSSDELQLKDAPSKDDSDDLGNTEVKDNEDSSENLHGHASEDGDTKGKTKKAGSSSRLSSPHSKQNDSSDRYSKDALHRRDLLSVDDSDDSDDSGGKDVHHSSEKLHGHASEDGDTKRKAKKAGGSSRRSAPCPKQKNSSNQYSKGPMQPRDTLSNGDSDDSGNADGKDVLSNENLHGHASEDEDTKAIAKKAGSSKRRPASRPKQKYTSNRYSKDTLLSRDFLSKDDSDDPGDVGGKDAGHSSDNLHGHASEDEDTKTKAKKAGSSNRRPAPRPKQKYSSNRYPKDTLLPRDILSKDDSDDVRGKDAGNSSDNLYGHASEDDNTKGKAKKTGSSSRRHPKHNSSNQRSKVSLEPGNELLKDDPVYSGDTEVKYVEHSSEKVHGHSSEDGGTKGKAKKAVSSKRRPGPRFKQKDSSHQNSKDALQPRDALSKDDSGDANAKDAEHLSEDLHGHASEDEDTKGKAKNISSSKRPAPPAPLSKQKDSSNQYCKDALQPIDALLKDDSDHSSGSEGKHVEHSSKNLHGHASEDGATKGKGKKPWNSRRHAPLFKQDSSNQYSMDSVQPGHTLSKDDSDDSGDAEGKDVEHSSEKLHGYASEEDDTPVGINSVEVIVKKKSGSGEKTTVQSGDKGSRSQLIKDYGGKLSGRRSLGERHKSTSKTLKSKLDNEALQDPNSKVPVMFDGVDEYGEDIVGCTIEVWWRDDQQFYDGVVDCFDPDLKKHTIVYTDGDIEILYLKHERFKLTALESGRKKKRKGVQNPNPMEMLSDDKGGRSSKTTSRQPNGGKHHNKSEDYSDASAQSTDADAEASRKSENHSLGPKNKQKVTKKDDALMLTWKQRAQSRQKEGAPISTTKLEDSSDKLKDDHTMSIGQPKLDKKAPKSGSKIKDDADSDIEFAKNSKLKGSSKRKSKFDAGSEERQGGETSGIAKKHHKKG